MERLDIVYVLREDIEPAELIYSLRSIEKNFPFRKVWFVGGHPKGVRPDGSIYHRQIGATKWERVHSSLTKIVKCQDITEEFYLFNDDFFVLKRITEPFVNFTNGTLEKRVRDLKRKFGSSAYANQLNNMRHELLLRGFDTVSYAVHMPILLDKKTVTRALNEFNCSMFRSVCGNLSKDPYIYHEDVKIYDRDNLPKSSWKYVSTTEDSFNQGRVGEYIREKFPNPSRFEIVVAPISGEMFSEEGDPLYAEN